MRRTVSIALVFLISWQTLAKLGIFAWYMTNQRYIANTLCVNRARPELHCNGKCILMQRLQAADDERREAQQRPIKLIEKLEFSHFLLPDNQYLEVKILPEKTIAVAQLFAIVINNLALRLLKPPQV